MKLQRFTTLDIVLMPLLAVANAVLTNYMAYINLSLTAAWGPIATSVTVGIYMVYGILAMYIIRKPGTAMVTYLLGATVQSLQGNAYGFAAAFVAAICYAIAVELVFYLFKYRKWDYTSVIIASLCAVPLWFIFAAYMFGYLKWGIPVLVGTLAVRMASGVVLCGILTKIVGDAMAKTGLLKHYAIGNVKKRGV